jgi:hypothetical protein
MMLRFVRANDDVAPVGEVVAKRLRMAVESEGPFRHAINNSRMWPDTEKAEEYGLHPSISKTYRLI